jgi:hypothetical protein
VKTKAVLITVCVALAVLCSGSAVLADTLPSFSASVTGGPSVSGSSAVSTAFSNSVPFHDTISGDAGTLSGDESANAGSGGVGGSSVSSIFMSGGSGVITGLGPVATSTLSNATYNDFMINGPGTSVTGTMSLSLNGTFETTASISDSIPNVNHQGGAIIDVGVAGSVAGTGFSGVFHQQSGATRARMGHSSPQVVFSEATLPPTGFTVATVLPVGTIYHWFNARHRR